MKCPRCQREHRLAPSSCDEPGGGLLRCRGPRKRRPARRHEIAAAIGVVLVGAALVTGIIAHDPRWRPIIAAGREASATWSARVWVLAGVLTERTPWPALNGAAAALGESAPNPALGAGGEPRVKTESLSPARPIPPKPMKPTSPQRRNPPRPAAPPGAGSDTVQIMVSLLVAELGAGPAWRTAMSNAESHAPDSPEFAYWQRVAAAIREGGTRPRL